MGGTKLLCAPAPHQNHGARLRPASPFALQRHQMNAQRRRLMEQSASGASLAALSSRAEAFVGRNDHRTRARCRRAACVVAPRPRGSPLSARRSLARSASLLAHTVKRMMMVKAQTRGGIKKNEPCRAADSYKTLAVESREDLDTRSMRLQTSHSSQHNTSDTHVRLTNFSTCRAACG